MLVCMCCFGSWHAHTAPAGDRRLFALAGGLQLLVNRMRAQSSDVYYFPQRLGYKCLRFESPPPPPTMG